MMELQNLFDYLLLLVLAVLPILYKYSFWLYTIQLKEYRWDRFREYLNTPQWKSALVNFWFLLDLPLFFATFTILLDKNLELIIYPVVYYYFIVYNIFVLGKIFRKKIFLPKITWRLLLTFIILFGWIAVDIYYILSPEYIKYLYSYLFFLITFTPLVIFFVVLLTLPLVNFLKNRKIQHAQVISNAMREPIKIWITWSYWKSTVKEFIASILSQDAKTLSTPENINTEIGVSNIVLKSLNNTYKYFVAEMWAYRVWEIDTLWKIVNHKYGFLTWVWNQHLWLFWSLDNIKKGKSEIQNSVLKNDWVLYINWNCKNLRSIEFDKDLKIVKYWNYKWSDATYEILCSDHDSTEFEFNYKKINTKIKVDLVWEHNIINITWTLALCFDLWLKITEVKEYLQKIKSPKNTLTTIKRWKKTLIDDTYNLSQDWLIAWLQVLKGYDWEKVLVMDDILELWTESEEIHEKIWETIWKSWFIDKILYCWINYKQSFIKWLEKWGFSDSNLISGLDQTSSEATILLEWKKTQRYLNNIWPRCKAIPILIKAKDLTLKLIKIIKRWA